MPALPVHYLAPIVDTAYRIGSSALNRNPLVLTAAEFAEAFIHPDHLSKLAEVHTLLGSPKAAQRQVRLGTDELDAGPRLRATLNFCNTPVTYLVPDYVENGCNMDTPSGARVTAWAAERRRMGMLVGDALDAINALNDLCGNAKAMALMFPALTPLMVRTNKDNEKDPIVRRGHAINASKVVGSMPMLPREVIDRVRSASALLQALIMAEDAVTQDIPKGASMYFLASGVAVPGAGLPAYQRSHVIYANSTTNTFA